MFASGFSLLLREQSSNKALQIQPGSIAEKCLDRLFHDMLWTSYQPFAKPKHGPGSPPVLKYISGSGNILMRNTISVGNVHIGDTDNARTLKREPSLSPKPRKPAVLNSWIAHSLADALSASRKGQLPALNILAANLQVTPNLLLQTAEKISKNSDKITAYLMQHQDPELGLLFRPDNLQRIAQLAARQLPA